MTSPSNRERAEEPVLLFHTVDNPPKAVLLFLPNGRIEIGENVTPSEAAKQMLIILQDWVLQTKEDAEFRGYNAGIEAAAKIADEFTKCNCHEAYTGRGLHEPNAGHIDYAEEIAEAIRALRKEETKNT